MRKLIIQIVGKRRYRRALRLAVWNRPLMASRKPVVCREIGPAPLVWTGRSSLSDVVWCSFEVLLRNYGYIRDSQRATRMDDGGFLG